MSDTMPVAISDAVATAVALVTLTRERDVKASVEFLTDLTLNSDRIMLGSVINALSIMAAAVPPEDVTQFALFVEGMRSE